MFANAALVGAQLTAIVILGAAVRADGPSPSLVRRTLHGAMLYQAGEGRVVIACGGLGRYPPTEAAAMRMMLQDAGVPLDDIHCDEASHSTYENMCNARDILIQLDIRDIVIVSDPLHAPRAVMVAKALGIKARSNTPSLRGMPPQTLLRRLRHEALAYPAYLLRLPYWVWRNRRS